MRCEKCRIAFGHPSDALFHKCPVEGLEPMTTRVIVEPATPEPDVRERETELREQDRQIAAAVDGLQRERNEARERIAQLELAIRWALGESPKEAPDFALELRSEMNRRERNERPHNYWWRNTLRRLSGLTPPQGDEG